MRRVLYALLSCVLMLLSACGGSGGSSSAGNGASSTDPCSIAGENQQILGVMQDWYYWYQNLPSLNPADYGNAQAFVQALRYQPLDRFSYVTTQTADQSFYSAGQYVGIGIGEQLTSARMIQISDVYPGSPAAQAGLVRGDTLLAVNGIPVPILLSQGLLEAEFGPATVGTEVAVRWVDASGVIQSATLTKAVITQPNVSRLQVFTVGTHKVGYFFFQNFIQPSDAALDQAFAQLKADGADELVVDERYNGGGLLSVAQHLASLIVDSSDAGQPFTKLTFNNRHSDQNQTLDFQTEANALGLSRVVFITTGATASAAELVINSLKPYMDVVTIGSATFGKPVGENGFDICQDVLYPMTFAISNAAGDGGYFDGLAPTCPAVDDLDAPLGDSNEASLSTALYYIANGSCGPNAPAAARTLSQRAASQPEPRRYGWRQLINAY